MEPGTMNVLKRILVPVEASGCCCDAYDHANRLAEFYGAPLTLLVVQDSRSSFLGKLRRDERSRKQGRCERLDALLSPSGRERTRHVVLAHGDPVDAILLEASLLPADLIVLGVHHGGAPASSMRPGSARKVIRRATCPVLAVPSGGACGNPSGRGTLKRILCPIDYSAEGPGVLSYALALARAAGADLAVLHVVEWFLNDDALEIGYADVAGLRRNLELGARRYLRQAVERIIGRENRIDPIVAFGSPSREILRIARERDFGLIVIGGGRRSIIDRMVLGSTTKNLLGSSDRPVLAVRPPRASVPDEDSHHASIRAA